MNNEGAKKVARREFMKSGAAGAAAAVVGLSALSGGLKEALAQARETGKPLLTEEALNSLFLPSGSNKRSDASRLAAEAKRDVKGFVRSRFTLTRPQEEMLESLSEEQLETIRRQLDVAERPGTSLRVTFGPTVGPGGPTARAKKCEGLEISITFKF